MAEDKKESSKEITPKGWTNAPKLADFKRDLLEATDSHDAQMGKIDGWLDNLHVRNSALPDVPKGNSRMQPKLIRKQAEWRYSALSEPFLSTVDLFSLDPVTWEDKKASVQNALVLNNQLNTKLNKTKFIDTYVRNAVDSGTIVVKLNWVREDEEYEDEVPVVEYLPAPEMGEVHQQLHQMMEENPTGYKSEVPIELQMAHEKTMADGQPYKPTIVGYEEVTKTRVLKNHPLPEICEVKNVVIDPSARGDMDKANFVIYSFETSLSALKKENRYENLDELPLTDNSPLSDPDHATDDNSDFNFRDEPRKRVIAYEYWGFWDYLETGVALPFVATWVGNTLIRLETNPYPDKKLPFVVIPMLPVENSVYGEPDGALLEDNQKIIGAVTRGMIDIMGRSANGQTGVRKDALDAVNRRKYQQGKDYEYNGNVDPRMAFFMHTYPEIPQSAQYMIQSQELAAESMSGVKAFNNGISGDSLGNVATGIRGAIDSASKREAGILRRLAAGLVEVGRKMLSMNAEFLEDEEIVRITNDNFVAIRRDDLAGNFDIRMDISTLEEDNAKAQELAFMLQTIGNSDNVDPGLTMIILRDIARLRKMPELAHKIESYKPEPDPMQEQIQSLNIAKLQAEVEEIQSRTQENLANAEWDRARAGSESAKARQSNSQADKTDLDFVEQESGVTQERQKELQGEQARGNMELERVKSGIKAEEEDAVNMSALDEYLKGAA
jgi:hypothetical protein